MDRDDENKKNPADIPDEDEITFDEETGEESSQDWMGKIKKLKDQLKKCGEEKQEYLDGWQRSRADYLNFKKEVEENKSDTIRHAKANILLEFLQLADSFEMAFANKEAWEQVPANWRQGVEYIHSQLLTIFRNNNLDQIDPLNEAFDPERDHSIGTIETNKPEEDNRVLAVAKKGYRLNGKIIRPAQVKVGEYKAVTNVE